MIGNYEKMSKAIDSALSKASKKTDSTILASVAKKEADDNRRMALSRVIHQLTDEMIDQISEDDLSLDDALVDFVSAVKAIDFDSIAKSVNSKGESKDEPEEMEMDE